MSKLNDLSMYDKARTESEPLFMTVLKNHGFTDVHQSSAEDDYKHKDVLGTIDGKQYVFDVKDVTATYACSGNYNMSVAMKKSVDANPQAYANNFIACRQYENGTPTGSFIVLRTTNASSVACLKHRRDNGKQFYLFNIDECMKTFSHRIWQ